MMTLKCPMLDYSLQHPGHGRIPIPEVGMEPLGVAHTFDGAEDLSQGRLVSGFRHIHIRSSADQATAVDAFSGNHLASISSAAFILADVLVLVPSAYTSRTSRMPMKLKI